MDDKTTIIHVPGCTFIRVTEKAVLFVPPNRKKAIWLPSAFAWFEAASLSKGEKGELCVVKWIHDQYPCDFTDPPPLSPAVKPMGQWALCEATGDHKLPLSDGSALLIGAPNPKGGRQAWFAAIVNPDGSLNAATYSGEQYPGCALSEIDARRWAVKWAERWAEQQRLG
jgi:hypothetical protein